MSLPHPISFTQIPTFSTLEEAYPGVQTFLFDMDGTLFDTEKYHTLALQSIGRDFNILPPFGPTEVHALMMGKADHLVYELVKDWPGFPRDWSARDFVNEKNRHLLKLLSTVKGASYLALDLLRLLQQIKNRGRNLGLVTSSEKVVTLELIKLAGLTDFFSYILTRDDSAKVKPDPWPYQTAMKHFSASPEVTLIFEDSLVGLEAARGSGAHVIKAQWYL